MTRAGARGLSVECDPERVRVELERLYEEGITRPRLSALPEWAELAESARWRVGWQ